MEHGATTASRGTAAQSRDHAPRYRERREARVVPEMEEDSMGSKEEGA